MSLRLPLGDSSSSPGPRSTIPVFPDAKSAQISRLFFHFTNASVPEADACRDKCALDKDIYAKQSSETTCRPGSRTQGELESSIIINRERAEIKQGSEGKYHPK